MNLGTQSLEALNRLIQARKVAGYTRNERLQEWIILGYIRFDSCGNTLHMFGENIPAVMFPRIPPVLTVEEFSNFINATTQGNYDGYTASYNRTIPQHTDTCPECGQGWNIDNFFDSVDTVVRNDEDLSLPPKHVYRHKNCHQLFLENKEYAQFVKMFEEAGFKITYMSAIPNQYRNDPQSAPWFMVPTVQGPLFRIGWRSHVIHLKIYDETINFLSLFPDEDVTKGEQFIHAWGEEKCVEYLKRIKAALT